MPFRNGILLGAAYHPAQWVGPAITPEIVILHDTASRITPGNAAAYLKKNDAQVSVHFVVERDGTFEQQVPVNARANHAGRSEYHGRPRCNDFSLGIEIVNPGRLSRDSAHMATAWFGKGFDIDCYGIRELTTPEHGAGLWMPYTEAQLDTVIMLLRELFRHVDSLRDITTHWYVSPGRKVDPNPLFPLEHVRALILGREDPADDLFEHQSGAATGERFVQINTPGDTLNLRRWPAFNPNVIGAIPHDTIVPVLRSGMFSGRHWHLVQYGGREGWVVSAYTDPVTWKKETA